MHQRSALLCCAALSHAPLCCGMPHCAMLRDSARRAVLPRCQTLTVLLPQHSTQEGVLPLQASELCSLLLHLASDEGFTQTARQCEPRLRLTAATWGPRAATIGSTKRQHTRGLDLQQPHVDPLFARASSPSHQPQAEVLAHDVCRRRGQPHRQRGQPHLHIKVHLPDLQLVHLLIDPQGQVG